MSTQQPAVADGRIIVGVDGSVPSEHALRWGAFLAAATGCTVEAVTAWEAFTSSGWAGPGMSALPAEWNPAETARTILDETLAKVFAAGQPASLQSTVREGRPAKALLDASRGARMLVMGSRGHGGFAGLLLGSVSATCAEHADCPVLVVHGEFQPADPAAMPVVMPVVS